MLKRAFFVLGIMFFLFPVFAQAADDDPFLSDDETYLSIEDQEAILDNAADAIIEAEVTAEHKQDSQSGSGQPYLVRIEVYSRMKTSYIRVGDLSLEPGFFFWAHDGRRQNGYAVYMYPVKKNASRIPADRGITMLYGKSFRSAEEAIREIQTKGSAFNRLIRYRPVVEQMVKRLGQEPYQGGSR